MVIYISINDSLFFFCQLFPLFILLRFYYDYSNSGGSSSYGFMISYFDLFYYISLIFTFIINTIAVIEIHCIKFLFL